MKKLRSVWAAPPVPQLACVLAFVGGACAPPPLAAAPDSLGFTTPATTSVDPPTSFLRLSPAAFVLADATESLHAWSDEAVAIDCAQGVDASDDAMRIETGICRYGVWSAVVDEDVAEPARLRFTFWHDGLVGTTYDEIAEGHLGVAIEGVIVVDAVEPIPSGAAWRNVDVTLPAAPRAGAVVSLHLHNHGANHWGFGPITFEVQP